MYDASHLIVYNNEPTIGIKQPKKWHKKALQGEALVWSALIALTFLMLLDVNTWLNVVSTIALIAAVGLYLISWILRRDYSFNKRKGVPYRSDPTIKFEVRNVLLQNCIDNDIYKDALVDCAAERQLVGNKFDHKPWSKMFADMNEQIKEQKALEKEKASNMPRKDWAAEMRIANKLENGLIDPKTGEVMF